MLEISYLLKLTLDVDVDQKMENATSRVEVNPVYPWSLLVIWISMQWLKLAIGNVFATHTPNKRLQTLIWLSSGMKGSTLLASPVEMAPVMNNTDLHWVDLTSLCSPIIWSFKTVNPKRTTDSYIWRMCGLSEDRRTNINKATRLKRDWTTSSIFINYSKLSSEHNWEDLCVQLRNRQTCTSDNHNLIRGGPIFNPVFDDCFIMDLPMQHRLRCVNLIVRSRRTWKTNGIIPTYLTCSEENLKATKA